MFFVGDGDERTREWLLRGLIRQAVSEDAPVIAAMVKALTDESMVRTGTAHFALDLTQAAVRCPGSSTRPISMSTTDSR